MVMFVTQHLKIMHQLRPNWGSSIIHRMNDGRFKCFLQICLFLILGVLNVHPLGILTYIIIMCVMKKLQCLLEGEMSPAT